MSKIIWKKYIYSKSQGWFSNSEIWICQFFIIIFNTFLVNLRLGFLLQLQIPSIEEFSPVKILSFFLCIFSLMKKVVNMKDHKAIDHVILRYLYFYQDLQKISFWDYEFYKYLWDLDIHYWLFFLIYFWQ